MVDKFDYAGITATASTLLDNFGKTTAIIRVKGTATSDPVTGTISYAAGTDTAINAVQVEHNEFYTPGALIEDGDLFWVLDGRANIEDDLVINDSVHNIIQTWPVTPGGTFIAMRVQTRGGVIDASAGTPGTAGAFDYSGIVTTASELIEQFGKDSVLLRSVASTVADPAAGTVSITQAASVSIQAVQIAHNEKYTPGALIETGDLFWVLDTIAGLGDEIEIDDMLYNIIKVWPTKPGDSFIASRVQTSGGVALTVNSVINGTDNVINGTDNVVNG